MRCRYDPARSAYHSHTAGASQGRMAMAFTAPQSVVLGRGRGRARATCARARAVRMCAERPSEPYPGFINDMKRAGVSEEEAIRQAAKATGKSTGEKKEAKVGRGKSLFKPDGTPYAPWMANFPSDYNDAVVKSKSDAVGSLRYDPQRAELSGVGLSYKLLGDELELRWSTGGEEGNVGFVVSRRGTREETWTKVSDYKDKPAELASKGPEGGTYSFLVTDPSVGNYVYRVSDVDTEGNVSDLAQCLVEIEAEEDTRLRLVALAVLLLVLGAALFAGIVFDPLSTT